MLFQQLSELCCNREEFTKSVTQYNISLKQVVIVEGLPTTTKLQIPAQKKEIVSAIRYGLIDPLANVSRPKSTKNF